MLIDRGFSLGGMNRRARRVAAQSAWQVRRARHFKQNLARRVFTIQRYQRGFVLRTRLVAHHLKWPPRRMDIDCLGVICA